MPTTDLEKLKQAGYKLTKPRQAVWLVLRAAHAPLSAQEVWGKTKSQQIDLVSVYRTLRLLSKLGLAQEEKSSNEVKYCVGNSEHHHVVCRDCGKTAAIPCHHSFNRLKNFKIIAHTLTLAGLCNHCYNQSN